jgi:DNA-binding MarR family transcriptional regulator
MPKNKLDLIEQVFSLSEQMLDKFHKMMQLNVSEIDLQMTILQMHCCMLIYKENRIKMSEIAKIMSLQTSGATQLINKLIEKNMVERIYDDADRRNIFISLTKEGSEKITKIRSIRKNIMIQNFENLSEEDAQTLINIYQKLV